MDKDRLENALKHAEIAKNAICGMIDWDETQDGHEYWENVSRRLQRIIGSVKHRLNCEGKL